MPSVRLRPEDLLVEFRDVNLVRQGSISVKDLKLKFQPVYNGVGSWLLTLPAEHRAVPYLRAPGAGILITNLVTGEVLMSGSTSKPTKKATISDPKGMISIAGLDDNRLVFDARAFPKPSTADVTAQTVSHDVRTGVGSTIMRAYVNANIGPGSPVGRRGSSMRNDIILGADPVVGISTTQRARFDNLGDLLNKIAQEAGGVGWRIVQVGNKLEFQTYQPTDRSAFIRLDVANGTLQETNVEVAPPELTRSIVAGQGDLEERQFVQVTTAESLQAETDWRLIIEDFKDQRQTDVDTELEDAGIGDLNERGFTKVAVKAVPSNDQTMIFMSDFFLGDKVAIVIDGQEQPNSNITEAAIVVDESGMKTAVAIGDINDFDSDSALRQTVADNTRRIDHLERNIEISTAMPIGTTKTALLPKTYLYRNAYGPTKLIIDGVLSAGTYAWAVPYEPRAPRTVTIQWNGTTWIIMGQTGDASALRSIAKEYPLTLGSQWYPYDNLGNSNDWSDGKVTVLPSGITCISGLIVKNGTPADGELIASMPAAVAPDYPIIHHINNSDQPRAVTIDPDGTIRVRGSWPANSFAGLDTIAFPAKGVASWTTVGSGGSSFASTRFNDYNWNSNPCRWWKDPYGFVWFTGLIRINGTPTGDNDRMIILPASCVVPSTKGDQHFRTTANDGYGGIGSQYVAGQGNLNWKTNDPTAVGNWMSLAGIRYATADAYTLNNWYQYPWLNNNWVPNGSGQPSAMVTRREDGLVCHVGLVSLGSYGVKMAVVPQDCIPNETKLVDTMSNNSRARVDFFGFDRWGSTGNFVPGSLYMNQGTGSSWFSLDGIVFAP